MVTRRRSGVQSMIAVAFVGALALGAFATASVIVPQEASAQNKRALAKKAYKAAKKAYEAGDFEGAVGHFKDAYGHDPRPELLFNIGQALREAGKPVEAATFLERYIAEKPGANNGDSVREQLFMLQQQIAANASNVTIQAQEEGLQVFVDDEPEARCVTPCVLSLQPVKYKITVTGEGLAPDVKEITPEAATELTVRFSPGLPSGASGNLVVYSSLSRGALFLDGQKRADFPITEPLSLEVGVYPASIRIEDEVIWQDSVSIEQNKDTPLNLVVVEQKAEPVKVSGTSGMEVAAYTLGGVGILSLAAGGLFGLSASDIESDLETQLSAGVKPNEDLIDEGETQALNANIFYGVGVIALGTGIALYFLDDGGGESAEASSSMRIIVAPGEGGGVVGFGLDY